MTRIYDKRTQAYDDELLRAKGIKMLKWSLNKYITGNTKWTKDFYIRVKNSTQACSGGYMHIKDKIKGGYKRRYYASVNVGHITIDETDNTWAYREYARIRNNSDIGAFSCIHPDKLLLATMAHEVAHAIHVATYSENGVNHSYDINSDRQPHGAMWQEIYRTLRIKFVNHLK